MTRQEKKEELIGLFCMGVITIGELIDECFEFGQRHPHWISVEDEWIRKKLISFVENWKNFRPNSPFDDYAVYTSDRDECDRILAWLEKQGHM